VVLRDESHLKKDEAEAEESDQNLAVPEAVAADGDEASSEMAEHEADTADDDDEEEQKKPLEGVFVVRDGKAVFVQVNTGVADQRNIEIIDGLEKGEEIVTGPFKLLRTLDNGDLVEPKEDSEGEDD